MERLTIDEIIEHCDRKTEMYEKVCDIKYLETTTMNNTIKEYWEHKQVAEYLRKFKDYKDLEEQGRLVILPCNVGDTVYKVNKASKKVSQHKVIKFEIDKEDATSYTMQIFFENFDFCFLHHFGETVFLTKSESEAKLKELRGVV